VLVVTGIGLLTGVQVLAARALGAGDRAAAGGAWRRGMVVGLWSGLVAAAIMWLGGARLFSVFGISDELAEPAAAVMLVLGLSVPLHFAYVASAFFLEAIQRPMASTIAMAGANVVNLVLNLLLVPTHGAIGSAWATLGARVFLAFGLVAWILLLPDARRLGLRSRASGPSYREFLAVGFAAAISQAAEAGAFSGMTIIAGRIGAEAVAAYQIMLNMLAVVFMVALGVASATTVLTSEARGGGAPREAARASWSGLLLNTLIMLVITAAFILLAGPIARGYTADLALAAIVVGLMPLAAANLVADGGQAVVAAGLRAHGDNWFPTASHVLSYALVMPALGLILAERQQLGVSGLLLAVLWSGVLSCGVLIVRLWFVTRRALGQVRGAEPRTR
jgi:multidrug resistance protein, MATE family